MINAWIVVRKDKHLVDKFWVCLNREDALTIARDVRDYWKKEYDPNPDEIDQDIDNVDEDPIFLFVADDLFCVYVSPQNIREEGESKNIT